MQVQTYHRIYPTMETMANLRNNGYIGNKDKNNTSIIIHNNSSNNNSNLVAILGLISDTRSSLMIQIHNIILSNNKGHILNSSSNSNHHQIFHLEPMGQTMVHHHSILVINNNGNILPFRTTLLFLQKMMR